MTSAGRLSGSANPFANIGRALFALGVLAVGFVIFAVGATFLLFVALAVVIVAVLAITFFWARARLTGRPFGPREQFEAMLSDMAVDMPVRDGSDEGVVLDAHPTPNGWSTER